MVCENNKNHICNCTADCGNHGSCCCCVYYHVKRNEFPACFFSDEAEGSHDRSLEMLLKDRNIKVKK